MIPGLLAAVLLQALSPAAQEASGSAVLRGRVVEADTGRPLAGVWVTLKSTRQEQSTDKQTDARGRYEFTGLAAGSFYVEADPGDYRAMYVPAGYSTSTSRPAGSRVITLRAGEVRNDIEIRLWRTRAINGRVVDEAGEPLAGASMRVFRAPSGQTAISSRALPFISTDDRGSFRIFGLPPGQYFVCAEFGSRITFNQRISRIRLRRPVRTCYPSATQGDLGMPVSIESGDVEGVEIRAPRRAALLITGTVVDADGQPAHRGEIMLSSSWRGSGGGTGTMLAAGGEFKIGDVPPGRYVLSASVGGRERSDDPVGDVQYAALDLEIDETDVEGVALVLKRPVTVKGRIVFDGVAPPAESGVWRITASGRLVGGSMPSTTADADGRFQLTDVLGSSVVNVVAPRGWFVQAIRWRGQDITDLRTEFDDRPGGQLEIAVSNRPAILTGYVTDEIGNPVTAGRVIVVLADKARWRFRTSPHAAIAKTGRFTASPLRLGEYLVVALSVDDYERLGDDPSYELIESIAERVLLLENDRRTMDLRLARLPDRR